MGQNIYLRDETHDLIESLETTFEGAAKADIVQEAVERLANQSTEKDSKQTNFFPRVTISAIPRVTIGETKAQLNAPDKIGEYRLVRNQHSDDKGLTLLYTDDENGIGLKENVETIEPNYKIVEFRMGEDDVIEEWVYECRKPALSKLNSLLAPLEKTAVTPREYQVWWLTDEFTYQETAEMLGIGLETVRSHIRNLSSKRKDAEQILGLLIESDYPFEKSPQTATEKVDT